MRILSIGQCSFDNHSIRETLKSGLHAAVDSADTIDAANDFLARHRYSLVLVNRILNATGEQGLSVVAMLRQQVPDVPVMLVSDYEDAQRAAVAAGALPGFGKSQLRDPAVLQRLAEAVGQGAAR